MVDIVKIVDIVFFMIDGNYGFEMEIMEFLNVFVVIGMLGNVFGIFIYFDFFWKL